MQSALDAKAFASITDSVTQLLLLREVLCTSELSTTTTASEALQTSASSDHRASGACWDCALSQASPLCRCCLDGKGQSFHMVSILLTQACACPAWKGRQMLCIPVRPA